MADDVGVTAGMDVGVDTATSPIYRFLRLLVHGLNRLLFRTTVEGREHVPEHGPVIVAPVHRSFVDFFVVSEVTGRKLHYMAKDNLWKHPRAGTFLLSIGAFPVHRGGADREAMRRAQRVLEAGEVLVLFPEGTRRSGPVVEDLHEGVAFLAARTGAAVVPVGIGGSASVMPKGSRLPRPRHVHIVVGAPLPAMERTPSGRVPRSQLRSATAQLREAVQDLYDRSVERTGRY
ncbi:MAG: lysophospholipid acyltransferase family protein [Actinomycetota bacterium]|jgi:1-acyl-sn-glycerol-3-phosphate acyltransferase|nr:lysophospholipid acyltransferase family protein [Actinomycetota bacterium]MDA8294373.1 lysophospholipid acyltransferase family protein [Actinomycetota bacterium]